MTMTTAAYETAANAYRAASAKYHSVALSYRARVVGDEEYLAARREFEAAGLPSVKIAGRHGVNIMGQPLFTLLDIARFRKLAEPNKGGGHVYLDADEFLALLTRLASLEEGNAVEIKRLEKLYISAVNSRHQMRHALVHARNLLADIQREDGPVAIPSIINNALDRSES